MDIDMKDILFTAALVFVVGFLLGMSVCDGCVPNTDAARRAAVKHGAAKWVSDEDGKAQFRWTTKPPQEGAQEE